VSSSALGSRPLCCSFLVFVLFFFLPLFFSSFVRISLLPLCFCVLSFVCSSWFSPSLMVWLKQICCLKDNEYPLLRFWKEAQKISLFFWFLSFSLCFCNLSPPCFFVLLPCSPILSPVLCVFLLLPRSWPFSGFYKARECHVVVTTGLVTTCIMGARDRSHKTCSMIETVLVPLLLKRLQHFLLLKQLLVLEKGKSMATNSFSFLNGSIFSIQMAICVLVLEVLKVL